MSVGKKILMSVIVTVVFFLLLEGVLALVGIQPRLYSEDPYLGFSSHSPLFVHGEGQGAEAVYETAANKRTLFNDQRFPVDKAAGTYRIFCVGGSTTYGRPYDDFTSFGGWLRQLLPALDPSLRWEVINAGGVSYASYRVALLMEEFIRYEPDLFVIYSGHNEFLEERTYSEIIEMPEVVRGMGALAAHTRIHAVLSRLVERGCSSSASPVELNVMSDEVKTLLDSSVGPSAFSRDDEQRQRVIEHYGFNLARMVDIARSAEAEVILVSPAGNLADCTPFKSEHRDGLSEAEKKGWTTEIMRAQESLRSDDLRKALAAIERAEVIDRRFAHLHYQKGLVLQRLGRTGDARLAFERALEEDVCPLRMPAPMSEVARRVAAERDVVLADFEKVVDAMSEGGIPGASLFLDHVHPTIEGNRLLAETIVDSLISAGIVQAGPDWRIDLLADVSRQVLAGVDVEAHGLALMKLSKVLGWAGKIAEADRLARQAVERVPDDSRVQYQAGSTAQLMGRREAAEGHYRRALELQPDADLPHQNLGVLLEERGDFEGAVEHYRAAIRTARILDTVKTNTDNLGEALIGLGFVRYRQGRFEEAVENFAESDRLVPGKADTVIRIGMAQMACGRSREAVGTFERVVGLDPADASTRNRLAVAYASVGRIDDAATAWRQAVLLKPEIQSAPDALPQFLKASGQADLADAIVSRVETSGSQ